MRLLSSLATQIPALRNTRNRNPVRAWGLCIHQTGRTLVQRAVRAGVDPLEKAIAFYSGSPAWAHYVIGHEGDIIQFASERERAPHAGVPRAERALYLNGGWRSRVSPGALRRWEARFPGVRSPSHLYPTRSPNDAYVGVELLPLPSGREWYTQAQYRALAALAVDVGERHHRPLMSAYGHLVGHEDVEPLTRWNRSGGWDPGITRATPRFSWIRLLEEILFVERST